MIHGPHPQAVCKRGGGVEVTSGMAGFKVLKTTQSGYEGFLTDQFTVLKPTRERILATDMDVQWTYNAGGAGDYNRAGAYTRPIFSST
jgi:urate oxidase